MEKILITFQADDLTREKLKELAKKTERSYSGWLRWIIDREYDKHSPTPDNGKDQE
jgi:predicted transcriptional regulator